MRARRCEPYIYTAVLRRVGDSTLSAVEPWTHYSWSDALFGAGSDPNRSYIGLVGGLNEADVLFRSGVLCDKHPTQFTARAFLQSRGWSQSGYTGNALAAGTVTVSAFTHDSENPAQEQNGYYVRMTTSLEYLILDPQPTSFGSQYVYSYAPGPNPQAWGPLRFMKYARPEDVAYLDQDNLYAPLPLRSFFIGDMTNPTATSRGAWGGTPSYGFSYSIPLYQFEFGSIEDGAYSPVYTYSHRMHVDLTGSPLVDSFYLTLGVHGRTAYATVGMNGTAPFLCFPGIVFDSFLPEEIDNRRQIPGIGKAPARFRMATSGGEQALHMPYINASGVLTQSSGVAPLHPVLAVEGRDVDDITSIVAMKNDSRRSEQQDFADLFAFGRPLCQSAAGEAKYRSTWPTRQAVTDVALFSGTTAHTEGTASAINLTLSGNSSAAAAKLAEALSLGGIGINSPCLILPLWMIEANAETEENAKPLEAFVSPLLPLPGNYTQDTECLARSSVGTVIGEFGTQTLELRQRDYATRSTPGEWYARSEPGTVITGPLIPDLPSKTYRVAIAMTSQPLWDVWDAENRSVDEIDRQNISRANHGLPPGTEGQWQQETQAFFASETAKFIAIVDLVRSLKNASENITLKSLEAIGTFTTYGRAYPPDGTDWVIASGTAPLSTVDQRLQFGPVLREPVKGYFDNSSFADGTFRKIVRPGLRIDVWANTETVRAAEVWKCSHRFTTEDKEIFAEGVGGYGTGSRLGSSVLGNFFGFGDSAFPINIRMFIVNMFMTTFSEKVADISTVTHNRLVLSDNQPVILDMDEETGEFTPANYLSSQLITSLSAAWA